MLWINVSILSNWQLKLDLGRNTDQAGVAFLPLKTTHLKGLIELRPQIESVSSDFRRKIAAQAGKSRS